MNAFLGADTEHLEQHATAMQTASRRLVELQEQLASLILDETIWRGSDAEGFRERWESEARRASEQAADEITRLASDLKGHASEQESTSADSGGGLVGAAAGGLVGGAVGAAGGVVGGAFERMGGAEAAERAVDPMGGISGGYRGGY